MATTNSRGTLGTALLRRFALGVVILIAWGETAAVGKVIRVSPAGNDGRDGSSWADAKRTVTAALAAAVGGDELWVAEGIYAQRISVPKGVALYGGFSLTEAAREQRDWNRHPTVLDGAKAGAVVRFEFASTDAATRLDGFTVRNGRGIMGGGIVCVGSAPTIANNRIVENTSVGEGGGICCYNGSNPLIQNNLILENYASDSEGDGGGICCMAGDNPDNLGSSPTIVGNVIAYNRASQTGGGVATKHAFLSADKTIYIPSSPTVLNNLFYMNLSSENEAGLGGGAISCITNGTVTLVANNTILANGGLHAGGILLYVGARDNPTIVNNTFVGNQGAALRWCGAHTLTLANNLVAFNAVGFSRWTLIPGDSLTLSHNCVYGNGLDYDGLADATGQGGNFSLDPRLAGAPWGNCHLQPDSPCVNAGDPTVLGANWADADGQARLLGGGVDIGADESDGTRWTNVPRVLRVSPDGNDNASGESWNQAKRTIAAALETISNTSLAGGHVVQGGEIWVTQGTYAERITLPANRYLYGGFAGTETAREQRDPAARVTTIDGQRQGRVVLAASGYRCSALDGFTITNGRLVGQMSDQGGGVECYHSGIVVAHNIIQGNTANVGGGVGGFGSSPLIANNRIVNNSAAADGNGLGGGLHFDRSLPTIQDNVISGNRASEGAGIYTSFSRPCIVHNDIGNNAGQGVKCLMTRSLYWVEGQPLLISRNAIYGHQTSAQGGGIWIMFASGRIENNLIVQNQVGTFSGGFVGGGMSLMGGDENDGLLIVAHNSVLGNKAEYIGLTGGGGIATTLLKVANIVLVNNIVAYNNTGIYNDRSSPISPVLICNDVWNNGNSNYELYNAYGVAAGPLNHPTDVSMDPQFVNLSDDFTLRAGSPCIDAGASEYLALLDMEGHPRSLDGKGTGTAAPDLGAFEYANPASHGTLAFAISEPRVDRSQGVAELQVTRTVGIGGAVSVQYATSDGSARAGVDYVATNGVLTLADLESAAVIRVPLLLDGGVGSTATLRIALSNPTGGALLGAVNQATLTLTRMGGAVASVPAALSLTRQGANATLTWTGTLQSATSVVGPWSDVAGAVSPLSVTTSTGRRFYRAKP